MLPVALTWQRMMSREFFVTTIDVSMGYLFTWKSSQVRKRQEGEGGRVALYGRKNARSCFVGYLGTWYIVWVTGYQAWLFRS